MRKTLITALALGGLTLGAVPAMSMMSRPTLSVSSPRPGERVTSTNIPVTLDVHDFKLENKDVGMPARSDQGHIHAYIDGDTMAHLTNVTDATHFSVPGVGLKPGRHTLYVQLAYDDHAPASRPVAVHFDYAPSKVALLPTPFRGGGAGASPRITIVSPRNGATVDRNFTLKLSALGFHGDCDLMGKRNVPGYGHFHVYVSQAGITNQRSMAGGGGGEVGLVGMPCSDNIPLNLSAWHKGPAEITVIATEDDHQPVPGMKPARIRVNLR